jgi:hypothetical protein
MALKASTINVLALERSRECQPPGGARDIMSTVQNLPIRENARANSRADGKEDSMPATARDSSPGFAENRRGPIAFDDDLHVIGREHSPNLSAERVVTPTR